MNSPFSIYLGQPAIRHGSWADQPSLSFNAIAHFLETCLGLSAASDPDLVPRDFYTVDALVLKLFDFIPDPAAIPFWRSKIAFAKNLLEQRKFQGPQSHSAELAARIEFWRERIEQATAVGSGQVAAIQSQMVEHLKRCSTARKLNQTPPPLPRTVIEVNWELLHPDGTGSWEQILRNLRSSPAPNGTEIDEARLHLLHVENPDLIYVGRSGFAGYVVFVFVNADAAFLESAFKGNALYVMKASDWRELSKLSKSKLLNNRQDGVARVVHGLHWKVTLHRLLRKHGIR